MTCKVSVSFHSELDQFNLKNKTKQNNSNASCLICTLSLLGYNITHIHGGLHAQKNLRLLFLSCLHPKVIFGYHPSLDCVGVVWFPLEQKWILQVLSQLPPCQSHMPCCLHLFPIMECGGWTLLVVSFLIHLEPNRTYKQKLNGEHQ